MEDISLECGLDSWVMVGQLHWVSFLIPSLRGGNCSLRVLERLHTVGLRMVSQSYVVVSVNSSAVRQYTSAIHILGIPTTRALCLVTTGKYVARDMFYDGNPKDEPGAIVCRVAQSSLRFGSYQIHASRGKDDLALLRTLVDYAIRYHFPHLENLSKSDSLSFSTGEGDDSVVDLTSNKYAVLPTRSQQAAQTNTRYTEFKQANSWRGCYNMSLKDLMSTESKIEKSISRICTKKNEMLFAEIELMHKRDDVKQ